MRYRYGLHRVLPTTLCQSYELHLRYNCTSFNKFKLTMSPHGCPVEENDKNTTIVLYLGRKGNTRADAITIQ